MRNIVFIGLPGCGKTEVSKRVAAALGRPWYDSDNEIEKAERMSVPDIFEKKGEEYFRLKETEQVERLSRENGAVIALGGGAVLRNAEHIRHNSVVIYVKRGIKNILATLEPGSRPLLKDPNALYELHGKRHKLYEQLCDIAVINDGTVEGAVKTVLEALNETADN